MMTRSRKAAALGLSSTATDLDMTRRINEQQRPIPAGAIEAVVLDITRLGYVSPVQFRWAVDYARRDPAGFNTFLEHAPRHSEPEFAPQTASEVLARIVQARTEASRGELDYATALNVVAREEPWLAAQARLERQGASR